MSKTVLQPIDWSPLDWHKFRGWIWEGPGASHPGEWVFTAVWSPTGFVTSPRKRVGYVAGSLPDRVWDSYWTPLTFRERKRTIASANETGAVVWVDIDGVPDVSPSARDVNGEMVAFVSEKLVTFGLPLPSLWLNTSAGRCQLFWALSSEVSVEDDIVPMNKTLALAFCGDRAAVDAARLMRQAVSMNTRHGDPWQVKVLHTETNRVPFECMREAVPIAQSTRNRVSIMEEREKFTGGQKEATLRGYRLMRAHWEQFPPRLRYLLTADSKELSSYIRGDRSRFLAVDVLPDLVACGLDNSEICDILMDRPYNKFRNRPYQLWNEIEKVRQRI